MEKSEWELLDWYTIMKNKNRKLMQVIYIAVFLSAYNFSFACKVLTSKYGSTLIIFYGFILIFNLEK